MYGVIQGGRWEDLRRSTCKKYAQMDFDGYGLGGAFLKETLGDILTWCNEELPENKPRHLLGLSHPDDILIGTEMVQIHLIVLPLQERQDMEDCIQCMVLSIYLNIEIAMKSLMKDVIVQHVKVKSH